MKSKYSFIQESSNGSQTVWSYTKQQKLINNILKSCPTAKEYCKIFNNTKLCQHCDPNYNKKEYINFLKQHVVKYSRTGKIVLIILISLAKTAVIKFLINCFTDIYESGSEKEFKKLNIETRLANFDTAIQISHDKRIFNNILTMCGIIGTTIGGFLTYSFLDKKDKENAKLQDNAK